MSNETIIAVYKMSFPLLSYMEVRVGNVRKKHKSQLNAMSIVILEKHEERGSKTYEHKCEPPTKRWLAGKKWAEIMNKIYKTKEEWIG